MVELDEHFILCHVSVPPMSIKSGLEKVGQGRTSSFPGSDFGEIINKSTSGRLGEIADEVLLYLVRII